MPVRRAQVQAEGAQPARRAACKIENKQNVKSGRVKKLVPICNLAI